MSVYALCVDDVDNKTMLCYYTMDGCLPAGFKFALIIKSRGSVLCGQNVSALCCILFTENSDAISYIRNLHVTFTK